MFKKTLLCLSIICGYSSNYNIASAMEDSYTYLFNKEIFGDEYREEHEKESIRKKASELDNSEQTYDKFIDNLFANNDNEYVLNTDEEYNKYINKYILDTNEENKSDILNNFMRLLNRYDRMARRNSEYWFISKAYNSCYYSSYDLYKFDKDSFFRDVIYNIWEEYLSLLSKTREISINLENYRSIYNIYNNEPEFWYMDNGTMINITFDSFSGMIETYLQEHNSKKGCYLLDGDMFHLFLANFLFNKKLLARSDRNFYFGSKNFYEALIVTVMKYKLNSLSLDELLFGKEGEKKYKIVNFDIYSYYSHHLDLLHNNNNYQVNKYFQNSFLVFDDDDNNKTPVISPVKISKINKETCLDPAWFGNISNNTSNLQKVLESFNCFKLKFDFEFTETELNIISKPREESIADFFDYIFKKINDYISAKNEEEKKDLLREYEDCDEYNYNNGYIKWGIETIKKLVEFVKDFKSCNIFPYIDKAIRNSDKFLRNLLNVFNNYYDSIQTLRELQQALLHYYEENEISDAKLNIIREWENEINSINNDN